MNDDFFKRILKGPPHNIQSSVQFINPMDRLFADDYKPAEKVLEELEENSSEPDFNITICHVCGAEIGSRHYWYYLKHIDDGARSVVICCVPHLRQFVDQNEADYFEIIEYSRCSAYHICMDLGNLRGRCQRSESLTITEHLMAPRVQLFCEPAQAGIVMAAHKTSRILDEFSDTTTRQFTTTYRLTILVIILTIINTFIAIKPILEKAPKGDPSGTGDQPHYVHYVNQTKLPSTRNGRRWNLSL